MNGKMDGQCENSIGKMDGQCENSIPPTNIVCGGYNKLTV